MQDSKVNINDLLIIVGNKKEDVFFEKKLEPQLNHQIKRHILFVEAGIESVQWYFKNYEPQYIAS